MITIICSYIQLKLNLKGAILMLTKSEMNDVLIYLSKKYNGRFDEIYKALQQKEEAPQDAVKEACGTVHSNTVTIIDGEYPEFLKNIDNPPIVLYTSGDIHMLNDVNDVSVHMREDGVRIFTRLETSYDQSTELNLNYCFASENEELLDRILNDCKKHDMPLRDYHFTLSNDDLISVIVNERGKTPYVTKVHNDLKNYQSIIGGNIEVVPLDSRYVVLCDAEGKIKDRPGNLKIGNDTICGTIIIAGISPSGEKFRSLTEKEAKEVQIWLNNLKTSKSKNEKAIGLKIH